MTYQKTAGNGPACKTTTKFRAKRTGPARSYCGGKGVKIESTYSQCVTCGSDGGGTRDACSSSERASSGYALGRSLPHEGT
jgi:hypothetical protein